jgi:hypothetical protein
LRQVQHAACVPVCRAVQFETQVIGFETRGGEEGTRTRVQRK